MLSLLLKYIYLKHSIFIRTVLATGNTVGQESVEQKNSSRKYPDAVSSNSGKVTIFLAFWVFD